jgi:signal peptidase complex subunit 1
MDFEGQKLAEWLLVRIILAFAAIGFLAGYVQADFMLMVYINAVGLALTCLIVLPDWPFFRAHPLKFLPALNPTDEKTK